MIRFLGTELWTEMLRLGKLRGPKQVAVAYYSDDSHVRCGRGDTLIVDASTNAVETRQTSPAVLLAAARRGTRIYSNSKLHAKMVLTRSGAIIGSANLSATSRGLREAGVLFTDKRELSQVARYLAWLQSEGHLLTEPDIQELAALQRDSNRIGKPLTAKPSLLEAFDAALPSLDDVSLNWYTTEVDLKKSEVKSKAKQRGVFLSSRNEWSWFEAPNTTGNLEKTKKLCSGRPMVAWQAEVDSDGLLRQFKAHDSTASPFIDAFVLRGRVVSIVAQLAFATPFDLRRDRKRLATVLSTGLKRAPKSLRSDVSNDVGVIATKQMIELYRLGLKKGSV